MNQRVISLEFDSVAQTIEFYTLKMVRDGTEIVIWNSDYQHVLSFISLDILCRYKLSCAKRFFPCPPQNVKYRLV